MTMHSKRLDIAAQLLAASVTPYHNPDYGSVPGLDGGTVDSHLNAAEAAWALAGVLLGVASEYAVSSTAKPPATNSAENKVMSRDDIAEQCTRLREYETPGVYSRAKPIDALPDGWHMAGGSAWDDTQALRITNADDMFVSHLATPEHCAKIPVVLAYLRAKNGEQR